MRNKTDRVRRGLAREQDREQDHVMSEPLESKIMSERGQWPHILHCGRTPVQRGNVVLIGKEWRGEERRETGRDETSR